MKNYLIICLLAVNGMLTVTHVRAADTTQQPAILNYLVAQAPEFQTFVKVLNTSELSATLTNGGTYTVFAPRNAAFTNLPYGAVDSLLQPGYADSLQNIVAYHILSGSYTPDQLRLQIRQHGGTLSLPTIGEGGSVEFFLKGEQIYLKSKNGYEAALTDPVSCSNGMIYPVAKILAP